MGGKVLEYEARTIFNEGIALGLNEGIVLGRNEGIASTARRMLMRGLPLEQIVEYTDLSPNEIEVLRDRLN